MRRVHRSGRIGTYPESAGGQVRREPFDAIRRFSEGPSHPAWYYNLTTAGRAEVEIGTETFEVRVEEITGAERDRLYAEQARRYPGFAEYEKKTRGVRTIPVLALHRS